MAQLAASAGSVAGGSGTLLARELFDTPGDKSLFRPSVLFGLGGGLLGMAAGYAAENRLFDIPFFSNRMVSTFAMPFGISSFFAGVTSAVTPKGTGGLARPTL